MAKIVTETVAIRFSRIVRDTDSNCDAVVSSDVCAALEQVAQEIVGATVVVEVESLE